MTRARTLAVVPALLLATACAPAGAAASTEGTHRPVRGPCLTVRTDGANAAMGLRVLGLRLVNRCPAPVRLDGHPVVRVLGDGRERLKVRILDGTADIVTLPNFTDPPRPFVLVPRAEAAAAVVWRNTYDDTRRPPVTGRHLAVAPRPGDRPQTLTPDAPIDLGSTGRLGVTHWIPLEPPPAAGPPDAPTRADPLP